MSRGDIRGRRAISRPDPIRGDKHMRQPVVAPLLLRPFAALDKTDCRLRLDATCGGYLAVCHPYAAPVIAPDVHGVLAQMSRDDAYRAEPRRKKPGNAVSGYVGADFAEPLPDNIPLRGAFSFADD